MEDVVERADKKYWLAKIKLPFNVKQNKKKVTYLIITFQQDLSPLTLALLAFHIKIHNTSFINYTPTR